MNLRKLIPPVIASLILMMPNGRGVTAIVDTPNPVLVFRGQEPFTANRLQFTRYNYSVQNFDAFPKELFEPAPSLPPCGTNTKATRTWVDFYDTTGKKLYGFCTLGKPSDLNQIWFALEQDVIPPSYVYIELNDRQTSTKYKSNLAETTQ